MASESIICPECSKSLEGKDPKAHAMSHWSKILTHKEDYSKEIQKRAAIILGTKGGK